MIGNIVHTQFVRSTHVRANGRKNYTTNQFKSIFTSWAMTGISINGMTGSGLAKKNRKHNGDSSSTINDIGRLLLHVCTINSLLAWHVGRADKGAERSEKVPSMGWGRPVMRMESGRSIIVGDSHYFNIFSLRILSAFFFAPEASSCCALFAGRYFACQFFCASSPFVYQRTSNGTNGEEEKNFWHLRWFDTKSARRTLDDVRINIFLSSTFFFLHFANRSIYFCQ